MTIMYWRIRARMWPTDYRLPIYRTAVVQFVGSEQTTAESYMVARVTQCMGHIIDRPTNVEYEP